MGIERIERSETAPLTLTRRLAKGSADSNVVLSGGTGGTKPQEDSKLAQADKPAEATTPVTSAASVVKAVPVVATSTFAAPISRAGDDGVRGHRTVFS